MLQRRQFLRFSPSRYLPSDGYWLHVSRVAMACRFEVTLPRREKAGVFLANRALEVADRVERQLTVFKETSDISYINRIAAEHPVHVDASLWDLLILCCKLHCETGGSFDITSAPMSRCWGFLRRQGRLPDPNEIQETLAIVGSDKMRLEAEARTIRFERPGVELNFGSIGKGYALDRMAAALRGGVDSALLSAGSSSLLAIGSGDRLQGGWKVGIRHPLHKHRRLAVLQLRGCAMSTSGSEEQFFEHQGKRYGHIIDPRSGWPAEGVASATVIAASAAITDALATAFYVGGVELAERFCVSNPGVMAIILESAAKLPVVLGGNDNCKVETLCD
jgi:thiamine biosynthesis lipoprotein